MHKHTVIISRAHIFPWDTEFGAEPQNFPFVVEFWYFHGISRNFAEIENSPAFSSIFDLMMYFYHEKKSS